MRAERGEPVHEAAWSEAARIDVTRWMNGWNKDCNCEGNWRAHHTSSVETPNRGAPTTPCRSLPLLPSRHTARARCCEHTSHLASTPLSLCTCPHHRFTDFFSSTSSIRHYDHQSLLADTPPPRPPLTLPSATCRLEMVPPHDRPPKVIQTNSSETPLPERVDRSQSASPATGFQDAV